MAKNIDFIKLRRITSSGKFIPQIDGLRFIAIFSVIIFHIHNYSLVHVAETTKMSIYEHVLRKILGAGHWGVELFFCISGFVLAMPFAKSFILKSEKISLKKYFIRRITRIEPPYIIALVACTCILLITGKFTAGELFPHLCASLIYCHNLFFTEGNIILPVAWSLEIETQFYICAPIISLVFILNKKLRTVIIITSILFFSFIRSSIDFLPNTILFHLQYFLIGFLFVDHYIANEFGKTKKPCYLYDVLAILGITILIFVQSGSVYANLFAPWSLLFIMVSVFSGNFARKTFSLPILTIFGGMCYSLYLVHFNLISIFGKVVPSANTTFSQHFMLTLVVSLFAILTIGTTLFVLIERPCMVPEWPKLLVSRLRTIQYVLSNKIIFIFNKNR